MPNITWKDVLEMQHLLTSIDFLEPLDERLDSFSDLWFGKWNVINTDIIICMKKNCTITIYRKGGVYSNKRTGIKMPKYISLEEVLSDESLSKKDRAKLAWLIGQVENYG